MGIRQFRRGFSNEQGQAMLAIAEYLRIRKFEYVFCSVIWTSR